MALRIRIDSLSDLHTMKPYGSIRVDLGFASVSGESAHGRRKASVGWSSSGSRSVQDAEALAAVLRLVGLIVEGKVSPIGPPDTSSAYFREIMRTITGAAWLYP